MKNTVFAFWASLGMLCATSAAAQHHTTIDPSGYITKYDANFQGIGPEVYFLPAPLPPLEKLTEQYDQLASFTDSLQHQLQFYQLQERFLFIEHTNFTQKQTDKGIDQDSIFQNIISEATSANDAHLFYATSNNYAFQLLQNGRIEQAVSELKKALLTAEQSKNNHDVQVIQQNLIDVLNYQQAYEEALQVALAQLQGTIKNKNQKAQSYSLLNQANISGLKKDYLQAENTIIRKVFPLFNRTKNMNGKAQALITLAEIYRAQNKLTEAQWFLIQARDIVHELNIRKDFAEVEFLLGTSKFEQKNYRIAQQELTTALQFAQDENNKYLQLAIKDKLGRIALYNNDLYTADELLKSYWTLRKELFPL